MIKKIYLIILIFFLSSTSALAGVFDHPQKLADITPQLPELKDITCQFKQEKIIKNSNLTLKSSGNFQFIKQKGVTFQTTFPIENTTSYTSNDYKQINDIINSISNKNYTKIENIFDFYFEKSGKLWILGLIPKTNQQSAKYLSSIEIEGCENISKIIIKLKNSTETTIWFYK